MERGAGEGEESQVVEGMVGRDRTRREGGEGDGGAG